LAEDGAQDSKIIPAMKLILDPMFNEVIGSLLIGFDRLAQPTFHNIVYYDDARQ